MSSREGVPMLSLDEVRRIADGLNEDLQRKANQGIRKKDWEQGIGALASMEAIKELVYLCELRAQALSLPEEQRPASRRRVPGNVTTLPAASPVVRKREKVSADSPASWRERVKG